jgi:hypothetical protein
MVLGQRATNGFSLLIAGAFAHTPDTPVCGSCALLLWRPKNSDWFAPSPHELAATNACVPLASYRQVHAGEDRGGGRSLEWPQTRLGPPPYPSPANQSLGNLRKLSLLRRLVRGEGTKQKQKAQRQNWRFRLVYVRESCLSHALLQRSAYSKTAVRKTRCQGITRTRVGTTAVAREPPVRTATQGGGGANRNFAIFPHTVDGNVLRPMKPLQHVAVSVK